MEQTSDKSDFAVPLNSARSGHLVLLSDTAGVTILTDPSIPELARGSFEQALPGSRVEEDGATNQGPKLLLLSRPIPSQEQFGEIMLNPRFLKSSFAVLYQISMLTCGDLHCGRLIY
jgi:hypothetical protein